MATPAGDSPAAHLCKDLENRLDKAIIRCNEANHVKKIYQQVVEQLQEVYTTTMYFNVSNFDFSGKA